MITYTAKNADYQCKYCITQKDLDCNGIDKERSANGQFPKGFSGNPGGRPRDEQKIAELARSYTKEAIETLVELMRMGNDERVRGTAAQALLERVWAKA